MRIFMLPITVLLSLRISVDVVLLLPFFYITSLDFQHQACNTFSLPEGLSLSDQLLC